MKKQTKMRTQNGLISAALPPPPVHPSPGARSREFGLLCTCEKFRYIPQIWTWALSIFTRNRLT